MKCFFHKSDFDGICSAAIIKHKYPETELIGVDYKNQLSEFELATSETVYVVDFSFSKKEMLILEDNCVLIWLDHHKTAIEMENDPKIKKIMGKRKIGTAGCILTWEFIYPNIIPPPRIVEHLGLYDVWSHKNPLTLPIQYGMRQFTNEQCDPNNFKFWNIVFKDDEEFVKSVVADGHKLMVYEIVQNEKIAKGMYFEQKFHGFKAIIINKPYSNSKIFDSVYDSEKHDIMIVFGIKKNEYKYTIYCDKPEIDVSLIAECYGGGGHRGAAGFYSDEYLF